MAGVSPSPAMAVVAANRTDHQPAADGCSPRQQLQPAELLSPELLMAARLGNSKRLKELLHLRSRTEGAEDVPPMVAEEAVVVQVDPPAAAAAQPPAAAGTGAASLRLHEDAAAAPVAPFPPLDGAAVTIEGDSLLHVVAASGDGEEFLHCAKMIVHDKKLNGGAAAMLQVLEARNLRGDTPLHCAAAAGNSKMISCLVDLAASTADEDEDADADEEMVKKAFLEAQNKYGETALHHVIKRAGMMHNRHAFKKTPASMLYNKHVVDAYNMIVNLMSMDPNLAWIVTHEGASPLFLAISLGEIEIARYLIVNAKEGDDLSYYSGSDGQNILHAAVSCGDAQVLPKVLNWLKEPKKTARDMQQEGQAANRRASVAANLLIKQLTSQRDKKNGSTPLHLAASVWGFRSSQLVARWSWKWLASSAIMKLLDANPSMAYQADKEGLYPIHVSAAVGGDIKRLLERFPDCASLRDGKGRTFLHVTVEKEMFHVVKYVCQTPALSWMLNAQDSNGDTALHRAVHAGNFLVFRLLFRNPQVRLDVPNKEGMRPIDVSWSVMPLLAYYAWDPRIHIRNLLLKVAAPYGESRGDLFEEKYATTIKEFKGGEDKISENLTSVAQVMGILSVLVTTVTFASAFTLPGGYRSAGDSGGAAGTPVLAGSYAFEAFLLADALAFICSLIATSLLLYAGVPAFPLPSRFRHVNFAYGLMMNSGRSLMVAFGLGLYVALHPVARTVPIAVLVGMSLLAARFTKASEGIDSILYFYPIFPRRQKLSAQDHVLGFFLYVLERFWSYILIFGIPAIRKWARGK